MINFLKHGKTDRDFHFFLCGEKTCLPLGASHTPNTHIFQTAMASLRYMPVIYTG